MGGCWASRSRTISRNFVSETKMVDMTRFKVRGDECLGEKVMCIIITTWVNSKKKRMPRLGGSAPTDNVNCAFSVRVLHVCTPYERRCKGSLYLYLVPQSSTDTDFYFRFESSGHRGQAAGELVRVTPSRPQHCLSSQAAEP